METLFHIFYFLIMLNTARKNPLDLTVPRHGSEVLATREKTKQTGRQRRIRRSHRTKMKYVQNMPAARKASKRKKGVLCTYSGDVMFEDANPIDQVLAIRDASDMANVIRSVSRKISIGDTDGQQAVSNTFHKKAQKIFVKKSNNEYVAELSKRGKTARAMGSAIIDKNNAEVSI